MFHGRGVMTFKDGRIKDGLWDNNVFEGKTMMQDGSDPDKEAKHNPKLL
jgi:hypothetical protein